MQQTDANIMSSIEVLWNEANAIEVLKDTQPVETEFHADENAASKYVNAEQAASEKPASKREVNYDLGEIGQRVEKASIIDYDGEKPATVDDAINRIKHATSINPATSQNAPQAMRDDIDMQSPEYLFGEAFTNLVRHIVVDYLDKSVEPIIRDAITSEIKQIAKNPKSKKK